MESFAGQRGFRLGHAALKLGGRIVPEAAATDVNLPEFFPVVTAGGRGLTPGSVDEEQLDGRGRQKRVPVNPAKGTANCRSR